MNCDLDLGNMTLSESHDTIVLNNIQIKHDRDTDFGYVCTVTLTLDQGHVTPLGQGKQWCKILSISNMEVRIKARHNLEYVHDVCSVTLTLEI